MRKVLGGNFGGSDARDRFGISMPSSSVENCHQVVEHNGERFIIIDH